MEGDSINTVKALGEAVSQLADRIAPAVSDGEVAACLRETVTEYRRLQALLVDQVAEMERRRIAGHEGYGTTTSLLQDMLRSSRGTAQEWVRRARELAPRYSTQGEELVPVYEHTAAAFHEGAIDAEHVTEIEKVLHRLPAGVSAADREWVDARLAERARAAPPSKVRNAGIALLAQLDPDGPEPDDDGRVPRGVPGGQAHRRGQPPVPGCSTRTVRSWCKPR